MTFRCKRRVKHGPSCGWCICMWAAGAAASNCMHNNERKRGLRVSMHMLRLSENELGRRTETRVYAQACLDWTKRTNLAAGVLRQQHRQRQGVAVPPRATPLLRLLHPHRQQRAHLPPVAQHSPRATPATRLCPPPWWRTWSRSATPRRRTPRPCRRFVQVISISLWSPPYHFLQPECPIRLPFATWMHDSGEFL